MKYVIKIIFGKEQVNKFLSDVHFSDEEKSINVKEYHFETKDELVAFQKGINEGVGWNEIYQIRSDELVTN